MLQVGFFILRKGSFGACCPFSSAELPPVTSQEAVGCFASLEGDNTQKPFCKFMSSRDRPEADEGNPKPLTNSVRRGTNGVHKEMLKFFQVRSFSSIRAEAIKTSSLVGGSCVASGFNDKQVHINYLYYLLHGILSCQVSIKAIVRGISASTCAGLD